MTPERAKELLPIITAYANGETIQLSHVDSDLWHTYPAYDFNAKNAKYRIKPKVPEYRLYQYIEPNDSESRGIHGLVTVCTRNTKKPDSVQGLEQREHRIAAKRGVWLTDWLPIPNYDE